MLVFAFAHEAATRYGKEVRGVSRKALDLLSAYAWPGNIRELKNEVDRAVLLATNGGHLESDHFGPVRYAVEHGKHPGTDAARTSPPTAAEHPPHAAPAHEASAHEGSTHGALHGRVDNLEREAILEALQATKNNRSKAAQLLGITRNGLALKMKRLRVEI